MGEECCGDGRYFEGNVVGTGVRVALVVSRFNQFVTSKLLEGAHETLVRHGVEPSDVDIAWVPGAFELPLAAARLAKTGRYDAIVCLGAVIRGATAHFDYVSGQVASGIARVALDTDLPVIFGVLTTDTLEQAIDRSGGKAGNKGHEAAVSAIEMVQLLGSFDAT